MHLWFTFDGLQYSQQVLPFESVQISVTSDIIHHNDIMPFQCSLLTEYT